MQLDIWSDVACPWCAVGRAHLQQALEHLAERDGVQAPTVTVRWRSFELDPSAPAVREGDHVQRLADKYGMSRSRADAMVQQMQERGRALGLDFDFGRLRPGNTFDAHRLLHLAHERGVQDALKERLFRAYFAEGVAVGRPDELVAVAVDAGLDEDEVREVLASDRYADAVRADERAAAQLQIRGVPFFVVDERYGVSGAQPPEVMVQVLGEAWQKRLRSPAEGAAASDPATACGPEGCEV